MPCRTNSRHANYFNETLNVATFSLPPYVMLWLKERLPVAIPLCNSKAWTTRNPGFDIELTVELIDSAHFENLQQVVFHKSSGYGALLASGQWNGMVGDIVNNITHVSLPDLTPSQARLEVADFIQPPILHAPLCFIVNPSHIAQIRVIDLLTPAVWTVLLGIYFILTLFILFKSRTYFKSLSQSVNALYNISFRPDAHVQMDISGAFMTVIWSHFVSRMLFVVFASILYYQTQKPAPLPHGYSDIPRFLSHYKLFLHISAYFYKEIMTSDVSPFPTIQRTLTSKNSMFSDDDDISAIMSTKNRMTYEACPVAQSIMNDNHNVVASFMRSEAMLISMAIRKSIPSSVKCTLEETAVALREHGFIERLTRKYLGVDMKEKKIRYSYTIETYKNTIMAYFSIIVANVVVLLLELLHWNFTTS